MSIYIIVHMSIGIYILLNNQHLLSIMEACSTYSLITLIVHVNAVVTTLYIAWNHSNSFELGNRLTKTNPVYFSMSMYIHLSKIRLAGISTFLPDL